MEDTKITAFDVKELAEARKRQPTMIRWEDTKEIETIGYAHFNHISFSERDRPHTVLASQDDIEEIAQMSVKKMEENDYEIIAECLNYFKDH